jgi:hypothetical protein
VWSRGGRTSSLLGGVAPGRPEAGRIDAWRAHEDRVAVSGGGSGGNRFLMCSAGSTPVPSRGCGTLWPETYRWVTRRRALGPATRAGATLTGRFVPRGHLDREGGEVPVELLSRTRHGGTGPDERAPALQHLLHEAVGCPPDLRGAIRCGRSTWTWMCWVHDSTRRPRTWAAPEGPERIVGHAHRRPSGPPATLGGEPPATEPSPPASPPSLRLPADTSGRDWMPGVRCAGYQRALTDTYGRPIMRAWSRSGP